MGLEVIRKKKFSFGLFISRGEHSILVMRSLF